MRKLMLFVVFAGAVTVLTKCKTAKQSTSKKKLSYAADVAPIMTTKCTPCHIPDKGGRMEALNSYTAVKGHIDDIIRRIELNPGEKGYMPMKKPKLSDSTINVFRQWKAEGMAE